MNDNSQQFNWIGKRPIRPDGVEKVTGAARYGADYNLPGMLVGKVLRSPHAHARIRSIDTSKAEALQGVKAVITSADILDQPSVYAGPARVQQNLHHITRNIMAREKALYEGHAVAAVAATSTAIANAAMKLIEVDYEILPHVTGVADAIKPDAPLLHEDQITMGIEPAPTKPSNIAKYAEFNVGDLAAGFAEADEIVEMEFSTEAVHQGYIEPHACLANFKQDGQAELWTCTQGHFVVRSVAAKLLGMNHADLKVIPTELGGAFGGKTVLYLEPLALALSRKAGLPVKIVMSRIEVFTASGPTSDSVMKVKLGAKKDGTISGAEVTLYFGGGAFPGAPVIGAAMCAFSRYDLANARAVANDVTVNRPKAAAYSAPGSPIAAFAVESTLDVLARKIGMDPLAIRLKNAARNGSTTIFGQTFNSIGYAETIEALMAHPNYKVPLGPNQGRGVASGFWFNGGGDSAATLAINDDGTAVVATGSPDVGGSRASMAIMAALVAYMQQTDEQ